MAKTRIHVSMLSRYVLCEYDDFLDVNETISQ